MKRIVNFFKSVIDEMKLVVWPTGKQWRKDVLIIIEMALIFAIFFALTDWGLGHAITTFLHH